MTITRIELPYRVTFDTPWGSPTYSSRTRQRRRRASRYFETKAGAVAFCGDERLVRFAPGEAWRRATTLCQLCGGDHTDPDACLGRNTRRGT